MEQHGSKWSPLPWCEQIMKGVSENGSDGEKSLIAWVMSLSSCSLYKRTSLALQLTKVYLYRVSVSVLCCCGLSLCDCLVKRTFKDVMCCSFVARSIKEPNQTKNRAASKNVNAKYEVKRAARLLQGKLLRQQKYAKTWGAFGPNISPSFPHNSRPSKAFFFTVCLLTANRSTLSQLLVMSNMQQHTANCTLGDSYT